MSRSSKGPKPTSLHPPGLTDLEGGWDPRAARDEASEDDSVFDRVTAVPSVSPEALAHHMMELEDPLDSRRTTSAPELPAQEHALQSASAEATSASDYDFDDDDLPPALALDPPARSAPTRPGARRRDSDDSHDLGSSSAAPGAEAPVPPRHSILELDMDFESHTPTAPGVARVDLGLSLDRDPPETALELADQLSATAEQRPRPDTAASDEPGVIHRSSWPSSPLEDMKERYAMGDFTGALVVAESLLEQQPDHSAALRYAENCRQVLVEMYAARFGSLSKTVKLAIPQEEVRWLSLDHRAGFLLSMVDGALTVEELLDVCGMEKLDALRILMTLLDQHVIALT